MSKWASTAVLDGSLDIVAACNKEVVCSQQPSTYTEAVTTYALADVVLDSGDFTKAAGDISGRKITIAQKPNITIDATGSATHVALVNTTTSTLHYVTTCGAQTLTSGTGGTVTIGAWDIEISAPS